MKVFITVVVTSLFTVLELIIGNAGLSLGLPYFTALYFGTAFGTVYGISAAGGAGFVLDLLYAREYLIRAATAVVIVELSRRAAVRMHRSMPAAPVGSGMICGTLINLFNTFSVWLCGEPLPGPDYFSMLIFQSIGGGIFMLLTVLLFDAVNLRSNLPRFCLYDNRRSNGGSAL